MMKHLIAVCLMSFTVSTFAATQFKIAVLAPEGTTWGNSLKKFAKEVDTATGGEVKFKIYYGGVAGDEPDVLRKVRIGQLQGGIFTGKTLGDISGDLRSVEVPFTFLNDQKKASQTLVKMTPKFNEVIAKRGLVSLGFYEIGQVYLVSTQKISNLNELKGVKIWSWEGDEVVKAMLETVGLVSVPLALPDVLSSLSTGIINAAYAPPLAILALQWHTKVKYLVDFPVAFSIGSLMVSQKAWAKLKPEHQSKVKEIAAKFVKEANDKSIEESEQAKQELKKAGVEFVSFPAEDYKKAQAMRVDVVKKLKDRVISAGMLEAVEKEAK